MLRATYRVQVRPGLRLADLQGLLPYLSQLGISHLYLSPILHARAGSTHGYDVVDPAALDPELGTEADLGELVRAARRHGMGLILDIVPNHMATGSENSYWEDVLSHGSSSPYARWFDIDWGPKDARRPRRIFLPILGDRLARVLARGELSLEFAAGRFRIRYFDQSFPIDPATVPLILENGPSEPLDASRTAERELEELASLIAQLRSLPSRTAKDPEAAARRRAGAAAVCERLRQLYEVSPSVRRRIDSAIAGLTGSGAGSKQLRRLLAAQAYRLAYWRRAAREINYRRFFTISHLAAVRVEEPEVFEKTHARIAVWVREGKLDGLRVDHIDGLLDPLGYLERLRDAVAKPGSPTADPPLPIFVEKILGRDEQLAEQWPVAGTTGYDFLVELEDLFIDPAGARSIEEAYRRYTGQRAGYGEVARRSKRWVLSGPLGAEVRRLTRRLQALAGTSSPGPAELGTAIIELLVQLPIYRTYLDTRRAAYRAADAAVLECALAAARGRGRASPAAFDMLADALLLGDRRPPTAEALNARLKFVQRFQQTSGPAAAKGIEDTALYRYVPLVSRNEVGGEPDAPLTATVSRLHAANQRRAQRWPRTLLCTTTHDTKRSADVRARLDVLSEVPDLWHDRLRRWHRWNRRHRTRVGGRYAPDANTEYLLYQTLVGAWPLPEAGAESANPESAGGDRFRERIEAYMQKAAREAKLFTSWTDPDPAFEAALAEFIRAILVPDGKTDFLIDLADLVQAVARPGLWNALSRTLIHLTAPGTPDIYQGDELWDFSLVDPDNRRPVDFERRKRMLADATRRVGRDQRPDAAWLRELRARPEDGRVKLHVIHQALELRRAEPALFVEGGYRRLTASGAGADHIFAFARRHGKRAAISVVPRRTLSLTNDPRKAPVGPEVWSTTAVALPADMPRGPWRCRLTGAIHQAVPYQDGTALPASHILGEFPVALLVCGEQAD